MIALWAMFAIAGVLEGEVVDEAGQGVRNATVVAYDQRLSYDWTNTDADGVFRFDDLPGAPYRLRVIAPPLDNLAEQWAGATLAVCEAEVFEVGGEPPWVAVTLPPGGVLRGTLVDPAGDPVDGAAVRSRPIAPQQVFVRSDVTDPEGRFAVQGLVPDASGNGIYRLEVEVPDRPDQFLPRAYDAADAEPFAIAAGDDRDLGTFTLLDGVGVAGTAAGPDGPVVDGTARVYGGGQIAEAAVVDGAWEVLGLPPGVVVPWVRAEGLATTWWPEADRPGDGVVIDDEGVVDEGLHVELPWEARLLGRVTGVDDPGGISVLAYNDDRTVGTGAVTDAEGRFVIDRLHEGAYTLYVYAARAGSLDDFVRDEAGAERVFEVPAEADSQEFTVALPPAGHLSGTATDLATGEPVYGATVYAQDQGDGDLRATTTRRDGTWSVAGIAPGTWEVWVEYQHFCPADPGWVSVYHPDQVNPAWVGVLEIGPGEAITWDPALPPDHDHDGMDDAWEAEHGLDPTVDDATGDPDGDGFTNLDEYLLGTDPSAAVGQGDGCGGCATGRPSPGIGLVLLLLWTRRRAGR